MSTVPAQLNDSLATFWSRFRRPDESTSTAILWSLVIVLFGWSAIFETDLFVAGMVVGSVLALGAIGLTLIFGILRFANFAHGDTMMLGSYVAFFLLTGVSVFVLRATDRTTARPFSLPLYPLPPLVFCATCGYMLYASLVYAKWLVLLGAVPLALGVPLYWWLARK